MHNLVHSFAPSKKLSGDCISECGNYNKEMGRIFNFNQHMHLTNDDRKNLAKISHYEKFNWYVEAVKLDAG
jgi:hypothetical protein